MSQEVINYILTILPSIGGVIGIIISVILSIRKISSCINEFKQSNALKENNEKISALLKDNATLKEMNQKLLEEITRIRPKGRCDDEQQN